MGRMAGSSSVSLAILAAAQLLYNPRAQAQEPAAAPPQPQPQAEPQVQVQGQPGQDPNVAPPPPYPYAPPYAPAYAPAYAPPYGYPPVRFQCPSCGWVEARYDAGHFTCMRCGRTA